MSYENTSADKWLRLAVAFATLVCPVSLYAQADASEVPAQNVQPALVTFVSNGVSLTGGFPGQKSQSFRGKLFAGNESLAMMQPAHFTTFTFKPGTLEFTAQTWMATGPAGGAHLTIDLVAGKHYFVEVRTRNAWPVTKMFGIKEITCQQALKEHEHDKPLEAEHIKEGGESIAVVEPSFPACS
jgi:hypothetical protein